MSELSQAGRDGALHMRFGALSEPPISPPVLGAATAATAGAELAVAPLPGEGQPADNATPQLAPPGARPLSQDDLAKLPLQALLVRASFLSVDQLSQALSESVTSGRPVEEIAVERGWIASADVERLILAKQAATGLAPSAGVPEPAPALETEPSIAEVPETMDTPVAPEPATTHPVAAVPEPASVAEPMAVPGEPVSAPVADVHAVAPQPPAEPETPVVAMTPPVAPQPTLAPEPVVASEPAPEPMPAPAPLEPTAAETAAQPAPELAPAPVAPAAPAEPLPALRAAPLEAAALETAPVEVAPVPALPVAGVSPEPLAREETIGVFLHLTSGERMWVGRFATQEEAEQHAQGLVHQLIRPELGVWPRFGARLIRPEAVVSIELSARD